MSAGVGGTGFAFFCDDFQPSPRDPLTCELCDHVEGEHPVHVEGELELGPPTRIVSRPPAPRPLLVEDDEWRAGMFARLERASEGIAATGAKLDAIDAKLRDFKRRHGIA